MLCNAGESNAVTINNLGTLMLCGTHEKLHNYEIYSCPIIQLPQEAMLSTCPNMTLIVESSVGRFFQSVFFPPGFYHFYPFQKNIGCIHCQTNCKNKTFLSFNFQVKNSESFQKFVCHDFAPYYKKKSFTISKLLIYRMLYCYTSYLFYS